VQTTVRTSLFAVSVGDNELQLYCCVSYKCVTDRHSVVRSHSALACYTEARSASMVCYNLLYVC